MTEPIREPKRERCLRVSQSEPALHLKNPSSVVGWAFQKTKASLETTEDKNRFNEKVHPNVDAVLILVRTEVVCGKKLPYNPIENFRDYSYQGGLLYLTFIYFFPLDLQSVTIVERDSRTGEEFSKDF